LRQLTKVTKFFAVFALCLSIVALGFAAKHGQFESRAHQGHYLSKSVKMDNPTHDLNAAVNWENPPTSVHVEVLFRVQPEPTADLRTPPQHLSLPLLL
jgi:hypothetical protein